MKKKLAALIVLLLIAFIPLSAFADTFYVCPDGDDANSGRANTSQDAWQTIQKAADTVIAGDTVEVQAGIYNESVLITSSGEQDYPITYYANGEVIIYAQEPFAYKLDNVDYIKIEGFTFRDVTGDGIVVEGEDNTHNIIADNVYEDETSPSDSVTDSSLNTYKSQSYPLQSPVQLHSKRITQDLQSNKDDTNLFLVTSDTNIDSEAASDTNTNSEILTLQDKNNTPIPISANQVSKNEKDNKRAIPLEYAPNEIIVKFKPAVKSQLSISPTPRVIATTNIKSVDKLNKKFRVKAIKRIFRGKKPKRIGRFKIHTPAKKLPDLENIYKFKVPEEVDVFEAINEYKKDPNVEYAEPNYVFHISLLPNDLYYYSSGSWGQDYQDLWGLHKIQVSEAWDIETGSSDVVVAVIDTGVDYNHEDLSANIWENTAEMADNDIDDDGNGYVDDRKGWDFCNGDNDPLDDHGHGSHCSGTIAAVGNNGIGIIGLAYHCKIMAVKGFDFRGYGYASDLAQCIAYAADNGADVLSNSWSGSGTMLAIEDAVDYAHAQGCVIVAAAGNSNYDVSHYCPSNIANVIAVSAFDNNDEKAFFSNYGSKIDVAAPGVGILSLRAKDTDMYRDGTHIVDENYYWCDGTSMACPHVSALAALIRSHNLSFTNEEIRQVIRTSADDVDRSGWDIYSGFGRINAYNVLLVDTVAEARISYPFHNDTLMKEDIVDVIGTATGDSYIVEYGIGDYPSTWTQIGQGTTVIDGTLCSWDISSLPTNKYNLKLTVFKNGQLFIDRVSFFRLEVEGQLEGWPQELNEEISMSSPTIADLDNDGFCEIIIGTIDGNVYVFHHNGLQATEWGWAKSLENSISTASIIDLDEDGDLEIILESSNRHFTSEEGKIYAWHHDGTDFTGNWPSALAGCGEVNSTLSVGDLDGNGDYEIVATQTGRENAKVSVRGYDGTVIGDWLSNIMGSPAIADINNDGKLEIIVKSKASSGEVYLHALNNHGINVEDWNNGEPAILVGVPIIANTFWEAPVVGDLDRDGNLEVVIGVWSKVFVYHSNGQLATEWGWPKEFLRCPKYLSLGDIDGDEDLEILFNDVNNLHAFHHDGNAVADWPVTKNYDLNRVTSPTVGDIDGDGDMEIVVASRSSAAIPSYMSRVYAWHHTGVKVDGFPKDITSVNPLETWDQYLSSPALADINNDGTIELVVAASDGVIFIWDLAAGYDEDNMEWPMIHHDLRHTGNYFKPYTGTISGKITLEARSNHSASIVFELRNPGETVAFKIYNFTTDSEGNYNLIDVPVGEYDLTAKTSNCLRDKETNILVKEAQATPNIDFSLLGGDCDDNNIVSLMDFSILRAAYGSSIGDPLWNEEADFNGNGQIDLMDFSILRSNYGTSGEE